MLLVGWWYATGQTSLDASILIDMLWVKDSWASQFERTLKHLPTLRRPDSVAPTRCRRAGRRRQLSTKVSNMCNSGFEPATSAHPESVAPTVTCIPSPHADPLISGTAEQQQRPVTAPCAPGSAWQHGRSGRAAHGSARADSSTRRSMPQWGSDVHNQVREEGRARHQGE